MATRRIKDITNTATTFASDDFIALDGATQGTRKMDKDDLIAEVSAGVSGDYLEEANNLSDVASLDTSKLNMEIPDVGTAPNEVPLNGMLGDMAYQSSDGVSVAKLEVTDSVTDSLTIENDTAPTLYFERAGIPNAHIKAVDENGTEGGGIQLYSSEVRLRTGGTQHVTLDSSGRLGIGTASPGSFALGANELVVGDGAAGRGITVYGSPSTGGSLYFADGTSGTAKERGFIYYNHAADEMRFGTAADTRWTINSTGNLVAGANLGIDFGSTTTGTGTVATNGGLLDDFERGTATPTDASGAGLTLTNVGLNYVKIGSQVTAWVRVTYPTTSDTSTATVGGFPFAFGASDIDRIGGFVVYQNTGLDIAVLGTNSAAEVTFRNNSGTSYSNAQMSGKIIWFCVTYDVS
jgi:hypothetical protein